MRKLVLFILFSLIVGGSEVYGKDLIEERIEHYINDKCNDSSETDYVNEWFMIFRLYSDGTHEHKFIYHECGGCWRETEWYSEEPTP